MSLDLTARVPALIDALDSQDRLAIAPVAARLPDYAQTLYYWAADELRTRGAPANHWPVFGGLFSVLYGTAALPDSAQYADVIVATLRLVDENGPNQLGLATAALREYAKPDDTWAVDPILQALDSHGARGAKRMAPMVDAAVAISALPLIGDRRATEPLLHVLTKPRHPLAGLAGLALANLGESRATVPLLELLNQRHSLEAIDALGILRAGDAVPALVARLQTPFVDALRKSGRETRERWVVDVARALGRIGDGSAAGALVPWLNSPEPSDALASATALLRLKDDRGLAVIDAQAAQWAGLRQAPEPGSAAWDAAKALLESGDSRGLEFLRKWYEYDPRIRPGVWKRSPGERRQFLQELGLAGDARDLPLALWAEQNDFDQTEQGWTLAAEATRTKLRIEFREMLLADVCPSSG